MLAECRRVFRYSQRSASRGCNKQGGSLLVGDIFAGLFRTRFLNGLIIQQRFTLEAWTLGSFAAPKPSAGEPHTPFPGAVSHTIHRQCFELVVFLGLPGHCYLSTDFHQHLKYVSEAASLAGGGYDLTLPPNLKLVKPTHRVIGSWTAAR